MERPIVTGSAVGSLGALRAQQREASLARQTLNHLAVDDCAGQLHFHGYDAGAVVEGVLRVSAQADDMTAALCKRIKGSTLDLTKMPDELAAFVQAMPVDGWAALQQRAHALDGVGITRVELSRTFAIDDRLANGLRQCTALRWLMLSDRSIVDFHAAALLGGLPAPVKVMHGTRLIRDIDSVQGNAAPPSARVAAHLWRTAAQTRTRRQRDASLAASDALEQAIAGTGMDATALLPAIERATTGLLGLSDYARRSELDLELCSRLNAAVEAGDLVAVHGLIRGILKSPPELVDHARLLALLMARSPFNETGADDTSTDLPAALQRLQNRLSTQPQRAPASNYSRAILAYAHPLATLGDEPPANGDAVQAPLSQHANPPMLHRVCRELHLKAGDHTRPPKGVYNAIRAYLNDILTWHALLLEEPQRMPFWHHPSAMELAEIFSARHSWGGAPLTAAQVAMNSGHPGAAGSMLMAILESQADKPLKRSLIDALDVDPRLVVEKLVSMKVQLPWVSDMADDIIVGHVALA